MKNKIKIALIVLVIIISSVVFVVLFVQKISHKNKFHPVETNQSANSDNSISSLKGEPDRNPDMSQENLLGQPVLIYSEEIGKTETKSRFYPTVRILRKIGNNSEEELVSVGKINEYPNSYIISPDKKFLLINLESKLQILDMKTKELKDLFIPKKEVFSYIFSPDKQSLMIWDQYYASSDDEFYVHILDMNTHEDKIINHGNGPIYSLEKWRDDGLVVISEPMGEFARIATYNLKNNAIIVPKKDIGAGFLSDNGMLMAKTDSFTEDVCNDMSGTTDDGYEIIDPASLQSFGRIKVAGKDVQVKYFSPDNKKVIYAATILHKKQSDCEKDYPPSEYYIADVSGKNVKKLSQTQLDEQLKNWGISSPGASIDYDYNNGGIYTLLLNGNVISKSKSEIELIGQYFYQNQ